MVILVDDQSASRLNDINRAFYQATARDFDATRQRPWSGWTRLLQSLDLPVESLLDIGCGNGRFARFLARQQSQPFAYCGIDSSADLLALARQQLQSRSLSSSELLERDIVMSDLPQRSARLAVMFGLLHHVPGRQRRRRLVKSRGRLRGSWRLAGVFRLALPG